MRLLILIAFSLTGCVSLSLDEEAHRLAQWNFTYDESISSEHIIYDSIDKPFSGDCDVYAFTLQRVIGGEVWFIMLDDYEYPYHAALVKDGMVYDNINKRPVDKSDYRGQFVMKIDLKRK